MAHARQIHTSSPHARSYHVLFNPIRSLNESKGVTFSGGYYSLPDLIFFLSQWERSTDKPRVRMKIPFCVSSIKVHGTSMTHRSKVCSALSVNNGAWGRQPNLSAAG